MQQVDILAIAAHPDDVELSCSGTLLRHIDLGYSVGLCDLTQGELGTRGTAAIRLEEAEAARQLMGATFRENLGMADGFFEISQENLTAIVRVIRAAQPQIVIANAVSDRHPDHGRGASLIARACFLSGLRRIDTGQSVWRPKAIYHAIQDHYHEPDFVVDISAYLERKMELILAFRSQFFDPDANEPDTPISSPAFLDFLKARAAEMGRPAGFAYGEGFVTARTPGVNDLMQLV